jgi:hypothetical protein
MRTGAKNGPTGPHSLADVAHRFSRFAGINVLLEDRISQTDFGQSLRNAGSRCSTNVEDSGSTRGPSEREQSAPQRALSRRCVARFVRQSAQRTPLAEPTTRNKQALCGERSRPCSEVPSSSHTRGATTTCNYSASPARINSIQALMTATQRSCRLRTCCGRARSTSSAALWRSASLRSCAANGCRDQTLAAQERINGGLTVSRARSDLIFCATEQARTRAWVPGQGTDRFQLAGAIVHVCFGFMRA